MYVNLFRSFRQILDRQTEGRTYRRTDIMPHTNIRPLKHLNQWNYNCIYLINFKLFKIFMTTRAFTMFFDNCLSGVGDSLNGIKNISKNRALTFTHDSEIVLFKGHFTTLNYKHAFTIV